MYTSDKCTILQIGELVLIFNYLSIISCFSYLHKNSFYFLSHTEKRLTFSNSDFLIISWQWAFLLTIASEGYLAPKNNYKCRKFQISIIEIIRRKDKQRIKLIPIPLLFETQATLISSNLRTSNHNEDMKFGNKEWEGKHELWWSQVTTLWPLNWSNSFNESFFHSFWMAYSVPFTHRTKVPFDAERRS